MAVTTTQVQQLYLAYFGRPAEQAGLTYWTAQANANVTDISAAFAQSAEYTGVYGSLTRAQTVDTLYQNLFGRSAASNELNYWVNSTDVSVSNLALALVNGATGTDRLLLDTKAQYAATITANAGSAGTQASVSSTYTGTTVGGSNLSTYLTTPGNTASGFYAAANTVAKASVSPVFVATTATPATGEKAISATAANNAVNFSGLANGSITLKAVDIDASIALSGANATSATLQGSTVAATNANTVDLTLSADAATTQFTTLNVALSTAGTTDATNVVGLGIAGLTELTTINAASSSAGLNIGASGAAISSAVLTSVTTGSGADTLFVNSGTTANGVTAAALTIDTGAGNDKITSVVNDGAVTINAGAGVDTITATATGKAALTINAGAGNDIVSIGSTATGSTIATAAHNVTITLGDGNDTLTVVNAAATTGANPTPAVTFSTVQGYNAVSSTSSAADVTAANNALKAGLVTVTDFSTTADTLALGSLTTATLTNAQIGSVSSSATLAQAVQTVAGFLNGAKAAAFQFGSDTYVYVDNGTAATVDNGDGLIQLSGVTATQLTAANFTHA